MSDTKGKKPTERSYILETKAPQGKGGTELTPEEKNANQDSPVEDMGQLVDAEEDSPHSSLAHVCFNYLNSILGSGVIGMPYALHQAGILAGIISMLFVAIITDYSLLLMIKSGHLAGAFSYQGIMEAAFGRWGYYALSLLQFVYPIIAMISYNVIVGDTVTKVISYLTHSPTIPRGATVLAATLIITLPLSLYRDVTKMAKISFLSLLSIVLILISIFIRLDTMDIPAQETSWRLVHPGGMVQAIGVFAFAFMCHHNTFLIYTSMKNASEAKWQKATHISLGTAFVVCLLFGVGGYATFTGLTQGDLLENYCWNDELIMISRVLFCFAVLLTFPLECLVARDVVENIFFSQKQPSTTSRHFSITVLIILVSFIVSIATDCLGITLELNGILAAMPLAYILPAICYLRLERAPLWSKEKIPALLVASFGAVVAITGLIMLLVREKEETNCSHGKQMPYCYEQVSLPHGFHPYYNGSFGLDGGKNMSQPGAPSLAI